MVISRVTNRLWGSRASRSVIAKIDKLPISESGVDDDNDPYVQLEDGTVFIGHRSRGYSAVYRLLSSQTRTKLKKDCLQVASDIVIRYVEGGLMFGGPRKQSSYVVKEGDTVSEMGAYEGFYSIKLAQQVGREGRVIAIEPIADNVRLLRKNMSANQLDQVSVVERAVWDSEGTMTLLRRKGDRQSSSVGGGYERSDSYTVKAESLDSIYREVGVRHIDFMIMQLNGAEARGLRGLESLKPANLSIAARYDIEGVDAALSIRQILEGRGYRVRIEEADFVFASLDLG